MARTKHKRFEVDPRYGLDAEQVEYRIVHDEVNTPVEPPTKTFGQIVRSNVFTFFNMIFIIIAVALACVGSFNNMTFLLVVLANTLIGIIQETRSKAVLDKLNIATAPKVNVMRGGNKVQVLSEDLVLDDIVIFEAGVQIPADAVILEGEIFVNESMITGESVDVRRGRGEILLSGSYVVSGKCYAKLDRVGEESYISRLTIEAKKSGGTKEGAMMRSLSRLIKVIGIMLIPLGALLIWRQWGDLSLKENIESTAAALIGMIPEGLYLLTSVALAVSVIRLAQKRTLVHELGCIETLARVNVLCVDKTGTITENEMTMGDVIGFDYYGEGDVRDALADLCAAFEEGDNATMAAIRKGMEGAKSYRKPVRVMPFSSAFKYSAAQYENETLVMGAPEFILGGGYAEYKDIIESYSETGARVVLVAKCRGLTEEGRLTGQVSALGCVLLKNNVRPEAPETFSYFAEQGVTVKVISGDNPVTVSKAAAEAGIPGSSKYIDVSGLDDGDLREAALEYTVFGRVTPAQKRILIKSLKAAGNTVAMTGDGINDVLALKEADCSVAMASGSDVACSVSQIVLLDSDFSAMPSVVAEGRRVINNVQRSASLFLTKNIFSFFTTIIAIIFAFKFPIVPVQMSLYSALCIGIPSFILALQPNKERVKGRFITNVLYAAAPAGITEIMVIAAVFMYKTSFALSDPEVSTISVILLMIVGFMMLGRISYPFDIWRTIMMTVLIYTAALAIAAIPRFLQITMPPSETLLICVTLGLASIPVMYFLSKAFDKAQQVYHRWQEKREEKKKLKVGYSDY